MMANRELLPYLACSLTIFPFDGAYKKKKGEVGAVSDGNADLN